jgi:polyisoprenoid-binding protein YceI
MKTQILVVLITIALCTIASAQDKLPIDVTKSELKWSGDYTFYFGGHNGTIDFIEGHFIKTKSIISGGEFIIDMNSITCLDVENEEANEGLVTHLKDSDFFDVSNHDTAKLVITSVQYHDTTKMKVYADLTIKGITKPMSFQAEIDYDEKIMTTKFKIDRMLWGVSYHSKMKDGAISDGIGFEVKLSL